MTRSSRNNRSEMSMYRENTIRPPECPPSYSQQGDGRFERLQSEDAEVESKRNDGDSPRIVISSSCSKATKCKYCIYALGGLLALLLCAIVVSLIFPYPLHASCLVKWKFGDPCTHVMQKFRCQILNWSSYNDCGPHGSKCLYSLKRPRLNENNVIRATHVAPNLKSVDKIKILFEETNNTCVATGESTSNDWLVIFDNGVNYCNLHNLVVGTGYDKHQQFLELTTNAVCTQYSTAICE